jgi:hypothetical protein
MINVWDISKNDPLILPLRGGHREIKHNMMTQQLDHSIYDMILLRCTSSSIPHHEAQL